MVFDLLEQRLRRRTGFGGEVFGVRSPLRACPLGAHVDHQGGEVTGLALNRSVVMVAHSLDQPVVRMESLNFPGPIEVGLRGQPEKRGDWGDYLRAAVSVLQMDYRLDRGLTTSVDQIHRLIAALLIGAEDDRHTLTGIADQDHLVDAAHGCSRMAGQPLGCGSIPRNARGVQG